jgi:hypothetical protein
MQVGVNLASSLLLDLFRPLACHTVGITRFPGLRVPTQPPIKPPSEPHQLNKDTPNHVPLSFMNV